MVFAGHTGLIVVFFLALALIISAAMSENVPADIYASEDSLPGHILDKQEYKVSSCGQCADAQTNMNLRWAHMTEGPFFHIAAQIIF